MSTHADEHPDRVSDAPVVAAAFTTIVSAIFARRQNRGNVVGGRIHWAKAAWLNITVYTFLVLPLLWWWRSTASPAARRLLGVTGASFAARGIAELQLVYATPPRWKCGYGITHDAFALATMGAMLVRDRHQLDRNRDGRALALSGYTMALLAIEIHFARAFREVMDPATGIYFADDSEHFRHIIRVTRLVVAVAYPVLGLIMWCARRDFPRGGRHA